MSGHDHEDVYDLSDPGDDRPGLDEDIEEVVLADADDDDDDLDADEDDELEDAAEDEIDFVAALYREDGEPQCVLLPLDLANDLEELIVELRRYPADAGALGLVSVGEEFFVACRVRGQNVQVVLSDGIASEDWPIARDVADFLGVYVADDESGPIGDLDMLTDLGCSEFDLESICLNLDEDSSELALQVADKLHLGAQLRKLVD